MSIVATGAAWAQGTPLSAVIDGDAAANTAGRIAVNQVSGGGNAQANLAALSTDAAGVVSSQVVGRAAPGLSASSRLAGSSFNGAAGLVSINQPPPLLLCNSNPTILSRSPTVRCLA